MKIEKARVEEVRLSVPEGFKTAAEAIEHYGRICYRSEDKITETSADKFVDRLYKSGHHAMLEFCDATVIYSCDRGMSHEQVRHRLASFAQECVSGSTKVHKKWSVKQLYDRSQTAMGREYNSRLLLRSVDSVGNIVQNKMKDIWLVGKRPVFRLMTKLGYSIDVTSEHRFCMKDGSEIRLSELNVGDRVLVNGRPAAIKIPHEDVEAMYLQEAMSPSEIADTLCVPYRSVLNCLHKQGVFQRRLNDKNKEKYTKNHTNDSYEKMRCSIKEQYKNGRMAWNKGLSEDDPSVFIQAESLRKNHYDNRPLEENSNWKGGVDSGVARRRKAEVDACELCSFQGFLEVHHIDKNTKNNTPKNLVKVCRNCHKKLHFGWHIGMVAHEDEVISITPLGFEDVFDIEMCSPYHNFVGNGIVTHNSTRYCSYNKSKFDGEITVIEQPSIAAAEGSKGAVAKATYEQAALYAEEAYKKLLECGIKPQEARAVLPIGLRTRIAVKANLREWLTIFSLRCDTPAHPIIRECSKEVLRVLRERVPSVFSDQGERFML